MKVGLVLEGGGGKGAYQIGVWKALNKLGITPYIKEVNGTSVGALNAVLFAEGDYEKAESIWTSLDYSDIFTLNIKKIALSSAISAAIMTINPIWMVPLSASLIRCLPILINTYGRYTFSRKGLEKIINQVDLYRAKSNMKIKVVGSKLPFLKYEGFYLRYYDNDEIKKILLASSAIPVVYSPVYINGSFYYDGGISDNLPDSGMDSNVIICVHLNSKSSKNTRYSGKYFEDLYPSESLGNILTGTLNFSKSTIKRLIKLGYDDTIKHFEDKYGKDIEYVYAMDVDRISLL